MQMRSCMRCRPEVAWDRSGRGWIMKCWRPSYMIGVDGYAGWCHDSILWLALGPTKRFVLYLEDTLKLTQDNMLYLAAASDELTEMYQQ
ncbi:hypothetical protein Droror1_Dr00018229, partial [Drosera rotundifolia]